MKFPLALKFIGVIIIVIILNTIIYNWEEKTPGAPLEYEKKPSETPAPIATEDNYELISSTNNSGIANYYISYNGGVYGNPSQKDLDKLANKFRVNNCNSDCNIYIFDTKFISPVSNLYGLTDSEYLNYADHLVGVSAFDSDNVLMYPLQDSKYKELGGKNWKRK